MDRESDRGHSIWILAISMMHIYDALGRAPCIDDDLRSSISSLLDKLLQKLVECRESSDVAMRYIDNAITMIVASKLNTHNICVSKAQIINEASRYIGERRARNAFERLRRMETFIEIYKSCYKVRWL